MADIGQLLILLVVLVGAGAVVAAPLLWPAGEAADPSSTGDDLASLALRHRIAVESLRDVEADRRAGSLDAEKVLEGRLAVSITPSPTVRPLGTGLQPATKHAAVYVVWVIVVRLVGIPRLNTCTPLM